MHFYWLGHSSWWANPVDADELIYRLLKSTPQYNPGDEIELLMFSHLERRWILILGPFDSIRCEWPYYDIEAIFRNRNYFFRTLRDHKQGFSQNPCSEIILPEDTSSRWRELLKDK